MNYDKYLKSKRWKFKKLVFTDNQKKKNKCCKICYKRSSLNVHHLRYKDKKGSILKREKPEDLMLLCYDCHTLIHDLKLEQQLIISVRKTRRIIREFKIELKRRRKINDPLYQFYRMQF